MNGIPGWFGQPPPLPVQAIRNAVGAGERTAREWHHVHASCVTSGVWEHSLAATAHLQGSLGKEGCGPGRGDFT